MGKIGNKAIAAVVVLAALLLIGCTQQQQYSAQQSPGQAAAQPAPAKADAAGAQQTAIGGRAIFMLEDNGTWDPSVKGINVTVDKVEIHSPERGWITLNGSNGTYDLLELKANLTKRLLAESELENGTYDDVRITINRTEVSDENGTHDAAMPSHELEIRENFTVRDNETSGVSVQFMDNESLHMTSDGRYVMAPVVRVQSVENASLDVHMVPGDNHVHVLEGNFGPETKVGMDENGTMRSGTGIREDANVSINSRGEIEVEHASTGNDSSGGSSGVSGPHDSGSDSGSNSTGDTGKEPSGPSSDGTHAESPGP